MNAARTFAYHPATRSSSLRPPRSNELVATRVANNGAVVRRPDDARVDGDADVMPPLHRPPTTGVERKFV